MDAIGSTAVRVAWWTEDGSWISRYSISCSENLTSKRNSTMATGVGHMQSAVVLDFKAKSINSVDLEVSQLLPFTNYSCCLIEHYINTTFNAEVCQHTTTLPQVNSDRPVCDSTDCPNDSHIGSTVSLFVMLLLAMLCILLLTLLVIKQGKDGEKITHW